MKRVDAIAELAALIGQTRAELEAAIKRIAVRDLRREQRRVAKKQRELHDDIDEDVDELDDLDL